MLRQVDEKFIDLYFKVLSNKEQNQKLGASFLTIFEGVENEDFSYEYLETYKTRKKISTAIAQKYQKELIELYNHYSTETAKGKTYLEQKASEIKIRELKNI